MKKFTYKFDGGVDESALHLMDEEGFDVITVTRMDPGAEGHDLTDDQWQQAINMIVAAPKAAEIVKKAKDILGRLSRKRGVRFSNAESAELLNEIAEWEGEMGESTEYAKVVSAAVDMLNRASKWQWDAPKDAVMFLNGYMDRMRDEAGLDYQETLAAAYGVIEEGHPMLDVSNDVEVAIRQMLADTSAPSGMRTRTSR